MSLTGVLPNRRRPTIHRRPRRRLRRYRAHSCSKARRHDHARRSLDRQFRDRAGRCQRTISQRSMTTHLYVPNADATFARALQAGAAPIYAPSDDHPSGDRWGAVTDAFGNTCYIATRKSWVAGPKGVLTVQPYLLHFSTNSLESEAPVRVLVYYAARGFLR